MGSSGFTESGCGRRDSLRRSRNRSRDERGVLARAQVADRARLRPSRFRRAEADGELVRIPTGDGMALVFFDDPQAPIECATEIARAAKNLPTIRLRMGIHSGPVNQLTDVSERANVAGVGIDLAQRVMDCGDAGHILLSRRIADDLAPLPRWTAHLHDLAFISVPLGVNDDVPAMPRVSFAQKKVSGTLQPQ